MFVGPGKVTGPDNLRMCTQTHGICGVYSLNLRKLHGNFGERVLISLHRLKACLQRTYLPYQMLFRCQLSRWYTCFDNDLRFGSEICFYIFCYENGIKCSNVLKMLYITFDESL